MAWNFFLPKSSPVRDSTGLVPAVTKRSKVQVALKPLPSSCCGKQPNVSTLVVPPNKAVANVTKVLAYPQLKEMV